MTDTNGTSRFERALEWASTTEGVPLKFLAAVCDALRAMIARPADADGWIEWHGGECPVPEDTRVDYKMHASGGYVTRDRQAGTLRWKHEGNVADIKAYRIHQPAEPASQPPAVDMDTQRFWDAVIISTLRGGRDAFTAQKYATDLSAARSQRLADKGE